MIYRKFLNTDISSSVIGIGTHQFAGEWGKTFTESEVSEILSSALDMGINIIDTAPCYGDHLSEKLIGNSIKNKRNKWIICSKFGQKYNPKMNLFDFQIKA